MKITKNIGMLLLAVYLIIDGLLGFGLQLGPAIFLLYIVALAAGVFILIEKNASWCDPDKGPTERQVAGSQRSEIGRQRSVAFVRGEEMAKEMPGDEEDDAGCSTEPGVQEPEMRRGHFL